jgi:hypothetical protein
MISADVGSCREIPPIDHNVLSSRQNLLWTVTRTLNWRKGVRSTSTYGIIG